MHREQKEFTTSFFRKLFSHSDRAISKTTRQTTVTQQERIEVLKALADETRLSIVQKLLREGGAVASCDILACSSVHTLSQPAMSHHFGKLVDSGVILETKQGTQKLYELNFDLLAAAGVDSSKL